MSNHPGNDSKMVVSLATADYTTTAPTTASQIIDTRGYQWARFDFNIGTMAGTGIDCTIQQDSDSAFGSGAATGVSLPTLTTANDNTVYSLVINCAQHERYLRAIWTFDTVTASNLGVTCTLIGVRDTTNLGTEIYDQA